MSNNRRNEKLETVLAVRLTTSRKPDLPSIVELPPDFRGLTWRVVCDDIVEIWVDEVIQAVGGLTPNTMQAINRGLAAALDLP
jgi:mRNA interferase MazF